MQEASLASGWTSLQRLPPSPPPFDRQGAQTTRPRTRVLLLLLHGGAPILLLGPGPLVQPLVIDSDCHLAALQSLLIRLPLLLLQEQLLPPPFRPVLLWRQQQPTCAVRPLPRLLWPRPRSSEGQKKKSSFAASCGPSKCAMPVPLPAPPKTRTRSYGCSLPRLHANPHTSAWGSGCPTQRAEALKAGCSSAGLGVVTGW